MAATLSGPSFALQGTTRSNDLTADGYTWANVVQPMLVDTFGKQIIWVQINNGGSKRQAPLVSNDGGATWTDVTLTSMTDSAGEGFLTRGAPVYDSINDLMHVCWTDEFSLVLYRRYTFTRDGSNNITGISRSATVNLVLDPSSGTFLFGFPTALWLNTGGNGTLVLGWVATNGAGTPNKTEVRLSVRALSNSAADNTAGNWVSPTGTGSTPSNGITATVAYYAMAATTSGTCGAMAIWRKAAGTNVNDLYVGWYDGKTSGATAEFDLARLKWNTTDWSNGATAAQQVSLIQVAGSDTGYSLKYQLLTKWAEDTSGDRLYLAYPVWKDNANGDTWAFTVVTPGATDSLSSRVDVYSAGGAHSFAPTGDVAFDQTAGLAVLSYIKTSTQFAYVQTYSGTTLSQAETLLFNTDTVDIPLLYNGRVGGALASMFRESTGAVPFQGYYGTMQWSAGGVTTPVSTRICVV